MIADERQVGPMRFIRDKGWLHCPCACTQPSRHGQACASIEETIWRHALPVSDNQRDASTMSQTATIQLPAPVTSRADRLSKPTLFTRRLNVSTPLTAGATTPSEKDPNEAWKYEGYQEFSRWMASDDDLFIFRRFESVNAHVILWMQHQITQKEARLEEIHTMIKKAQPEQRLRNDSFSWDAQWFGERDNLMRELSALVLHYSKCIVYAREFSTGLP